MRRPGMSESRFADILGAQIPDREKRRRADFIVATALGRSVAFRGLKGIVRTLRQREKPRPHRGEKSCARS